MSNSPKSWYITGASSGFGEALAQYCLAKGDHVAATFRKDAQAREFTNSHDNALGVVTDVTDKAQVEAGIKATVERFGGIDVIVNNAGYGHIGILEEADDEQIRHQFDVNVFGPMRVVRAALPTLREQGGGHIINITSIGGLSAAPGFSLYNGSKFALEGIGESLAKELAPFNVRVTNVEPGPFRTKWAGESATIMPPEIPGYEESAGKFVTFINDINGKQPGDPARAAAAMYAVTRLDEPPVHLPLGGPAYKNARAKVELLSSEIDQHESLGLPTDFSEAEMAEMARESS